MVKGKKRKMITKKMLQLTDKRLYVRGVFANLHTQAASPRSKTNQAAEAAEQEAREEEGVAHVRPAASNLFFSYNTNLGPPYHVLLDTNMINFSLQNKLEIVSAMMDCLYAKCIPYITDCVMAELEKLGSKFRVAVRIAKDPRFRRLTCTHKGTYADDCIVERVEAHKVCACVRVLRQPELTGLLQCYIVGTCDRELKHRIRKIPGVPIMYIRNRKYTVERLPEAYGDKNNFQ